jgi:hypothetical protein
MGDDRAFASVDVRATRSRIVIQEFEGGQS